MIGLKVVMGDPGRSADPFGIVGAQYNLNKHKIQFKLAKQFIKKPYSQPAKYFRNIHHKIKPNFMGIELNNRGKKLLKLWHSEKYNMKYIHGVNTSANLTEKTRQKGYSMDKPFMVEWFKEQQKLGLFEFPSIPSPDMQELIDQIPQIVAMKTLTGATTYRAQRGRHDDLFMAALHCCNFIRLFIEQQERLK